MDEREQQRWDDGREEPVLDVLPQPAWPVPIQPVQQVRSSYVTALAVQKPRVLRDVQRRFLEECALLSDSAYYGWGAGKDRVEGPSVEMAMAAARCWGNAAVEHGPVAETPTSYIFTAYWIDLETGSTIGRPFRQSRRWVIHGKMDEERKEDMRFQIGASKAARNVILSALPRWLIERGMETAKAGVRKKIEAYIQKHSIEAARSFMVAEFKKVGVPEELVTSKMNRTNTAGLTIEDMVVLQGDLKAIQTGAESVSSIFPVLEPETKADPPGQSRTETLKEKLKSDKQ